MKLNKTLFYILSFTWGLPMTMLGAVVTLVLMVLGYKPQRYGSCVYVKVGKIWGGFSLGLFLITDRIAGASTLSHEHGHAVQNCIFGPLMPFVIGIPSALRYWLRKINTRLGYKNRRPYYDIWFEKQATKWGKEYYYYNYELPILVAKDVHERITGFIRNTEDTIYGDHVPKLALEDKKDDNSES